MKAREAAHAPAAGHASGTDRRRALPVRPR